MFLLMKVYPRRLYRAATMNYFITRYHALDVHYCRHRDSRIIFILGVRIYLKKKSETRLSEIQ